MASISEGQAHLFETDKYDLRTDAKHVISRRLAKGNKTDEFSRVKKEIRAQLKDLYGEAPDKDSIFYGAARQFSEAYPDDGEAPDVEEIAKRKPVPPRSMDEIDVSSMDLDNVDVVADASWVYSHLYAKDVDKGSAPSPGAWGLLQWAKTHEKEFFSGVFLKVVKPVEVEDDIAVKAELKSADQRLRVVTKMLAESRSEVLDLLNQEVDDGEATDDGVDARGPDDTDAGVEEVGAPGARDREPGERGVEGHPDPSA